MSSRYGALRAQAVAATLVVSVVAVLVVGSGAAAAAQPGGGARPAAPSLLARGVGYDQVGGSERVRALQSALRRLKHDPGPVDGVFGPRTEAAVRAFQRRHRLAVDGIVGPATATALRRRGATRAAAARRPNRGRGRPAVAPQGAVRRAEPAGAERTPAAAERTDGRARTRPAASSRASGQPEAGSDSPNAVLAGLALALGVVGVGALVVARRRRRRPVPASHSAPDPRGQSGATATATATAPRPSQPERSPAADTAGPLPSRPERRDGRRVAPTVPPDGYEPESPRTARIDPGGRRAVELAARLAAAPATGRAPLRALGYLGGLDESEIGAQAAQMEQLSERRGWTLVELVGAAEPETDARVMPRALERALERIGAGEAELLVLVRPDQLGGSVAKLAAALDRLKRHGGRLACLEPAIDSTAPDSDGTLASLLGTAATPRRFVAGGPERSGSASAPRARPPAPTSGAPNGDRPPTPTSGAPNGDRPPAPASSAPNGGGPPTPTSGAPNGGGSSTERSLRARIVAMRANGMPVEAIAARLERDGVPVPGGGRWLPSSVEAAVGGNGRKLAAGAEDTRAGSRAIVAADSPPSERSR